MDGGFDGVGGIESVFGEVDFLCSSLLVSLIMKGRRSKRVEAEDEP